MVLNEEKVKDLIVSEDVDMLVKEMLPYTDIDEEDIDPNLAEQLCKAQLLVWSRVMHLTREDDAKKSILTQAYQEIGRCWMMLGDTEKAVIQMTKALAIKKSFPTLLFLSNIHLNDSNYDEAVKFGEMAIEHACNDEDRCKGYTKLGIILQAKGDFEPAVEAFKKATVLEAIDEKSEVYADLHTKLGTLHETMGNYQEAVDEFRLAADALTTLFGKDDDRTEEVAYMLDLASSNLD